jgi:hypothetical protein
MMTGRPGHTIFTGIDHFTLALPIGKNEQSIFGMFNRLT